MTDSFVWVFMDQDRKGIEHILEDALSVRNPDTRTATLCILLGSECDFDAFYTESGALNYATFNAGKQRYEAMKAAETVQ